MIAKPYVYAAAALAVAAATWTVSGWYYGSRIESQARAFESERRIAAEKLAEAQAKAIDLQSQINNAADAHLKEIANAQAENIRLRTGIERGDYRVYVRAHCPKLPATTESPGVDSGAGAELDADARQDYYSLRDQIARTEGKLKACQDAARLINQPK